MEKKIKLRTKIFAPIAVFVFLAGLVSLFFVSTFVVSDLGDEQIHDSEENTWKTLDKIAKSEIQRIYQKIDKYGLSAITEASTFNSLPQVIETYEQALNGNIDNEADTIVQNARVQLRQFITPISRNIARDTGKEIRLHFHMKNNRSFLRCWRDG